ncbi:hypothetical protein K1W69_01665 [Hoeflea sp. WL0058]|uniref:Uncharacterized protein n=1 Tax=Flavimaribacter sediminis TaxID=2865987 RepID=A0AAE2ZJT6_9HYPH|nr:hypothetical protein [Flavimaribacter sediminis]MBW8635875.1 hypothetical protein [Flavimaribacter sediminis]
MSYENIVAAENSANKNQRLDVLTAALEEIIDRSYNGELGTSKVIDMRKIAQAALQDLPQNV